MEGECRRWNGGRAILSMEGECRRWKGITVAIELIAGALAATTPWMEGHLGEALFLRKN